MSTNFDPKNSPFCQIDTIKSWLPKEYHKQIDKIQRDIASEVPENPESLDYTMLVENDDQFFGRTFHTQAALEVLCLREIKDLTQRKKDFVVLELAGGIGLAFWKMVLASGGKGTCYFNEVTPKMLNKFDTTMIKRLSKEQTKNIVKIACDCFKILETHPKLKGKVDVLLIKNLEHFLNKQQMDALVKLVSQLLTPGGKLFTTAHSFINISKDHAVYRFYQSQLLKGSIYPGFAKLIRLLEVVVLVDRRDHTINSKEHLERVLHNLQSALASKQGEERDDILSQLDKIGKFTIECVNKAIAYFYPQTSTEHKPVFLVSKEKSSMIKRTIPAVSSKDRKKLYDDLEKKLFSDTLTKEISSGTYQLQQCQKLLVSLKELDEVDLSQNRHYIAPVASVRINKLARFLDVGFLLVLDMLDKGFAEQDYVLEGQTRSLSYSHCLWDFVQRIQQLLPDLRIDDQAEAELKLLEQLWMKQLHYPGMETDNVILLLLMSLKDQSRACVEMSGIDISEGTVLRLTNRYGQDMENWKNVYDDQDLALIQSRSVGYFSLELFSDILGRMVKELQKRKKRSG